MAADCGFIYFWARILDFACEFQIQGENRRVDLVKS